MIYDKRLDFRFYGLEQFKSPIKRLYWNCLEGFLSAFIVFLLLLSTKGISAQNAAQLSMVNGDIKYRKTGSINWVDLGETRELFPGDLIFLKKNASADLQYSNNSAIVHLSGQLLFRVTLKAPIHSKRIHRFGLEKGSQSQPTKRILNPFERGMVRNSSESTDKSRQNDENRLKIYRNVEEILLSKPTPGSIFAVTQFPAKLLVKVDNIKPNNKYWVFLWNEENRVTPTWSSYSAGEFYDVSIAGPGLYEIQVLNDDETEISAPIKVEYIKSDENFSDLGSTLTNSKGDQTIILE